MATVLKPGPSEGKLRAGRHSLVAHRSKRCRALAFEAVAGGRGFDGCGAWASTPVVATLKEGVASSTLQVSRDVPKTPAGQPRSQAGPSWEMKFTAQQPAWTSPAHLQAGHRPWELCPAMLPARPP